MASSRKTNGKGDLVLSLEALGDPEAEQNFVSFLPYGKTKEPFYSLLTAGGPIANAHPKAQTAVVIPNKTNKNNQNPSPNFF